MIRWALEMRLGLVFTLSLAVAKAAQGQAATASDAPAAGCELSYRVTPRHDATPRFLDVELSFPAGGRSVTYLRAGSEFGGVDDFGKALTGWQGAMEGVEVEATDRSFRWKVSHPKDGRVQVRFQARAALADPDDGKPQEAAQLYRTQIGKDWFQFLGLGVLVTAEPWADNSRPRQCVTLAQPGQADAPLFGSHLNARGATASFAITDSPSLLRHAFYAGGPGWRVTTRELPNGPVHTAVRGQFDMGDEAFADAVISLLKVHRQFWGDGRAAPQWVVLTPNFAKDSSAGTLVHQAALLHAGADISPTAGAFESLVAHENLHQWIPARFGRRTPDQGNPVPEYWFSEGFTNYYTHRLLLAAGLWTLPRYAEQLTKVLRGYWGSPARNATVSSIAPRFFSDHDAGRQMYSRGEVLAMRWDRGLRQQGHPGLDAVLKALLLPQGISPAGGALATDRVLDALALDLGLIPRRDVLGHVVDGTTLPLDEGLAGPCFALRWDDVPRWTLGFDNDSFKTRTVRGIVPGGPAHAAGLRDGMALAGWAVYGGDIQRDVVLTLRTPEGLQDMRYRPVDGSGQRLPTVTTRPGAEAEPACLSWRYR